MAGCYRSAAAEDTPQPPVADLVIQLDAYVTKIGETLTELHGTVNYKLDSDFVVRDASGLALVALAIALHTDESRYKKSAPAIITQAAALAKIDNYDEALKCFETLKSAVAGEEVIAMARWADVAEEVDLTPVMKAVPNLAALLKRLTNTETKMKRMVAKPESVYGATAALAAISQGSIANATDTIKPDERDIWKKECEQFRDAALAVNAALHDYAAGKIDYAAYWKAHNRMTESCETCHALFSPAASGHAAIPIIPPSR